MKQLLNRIFAHEEINGHNICPTYLHRWTLLKFGSLFSVYLHKFVGDDWALDLHDHPKRFISIGLKGQYGEWTRRNDEDLYGFRIWRAPWIRTFPATHIHRLIGPTPQRPCWTLVIVLRAVRAWGFWNSGRFIPWRQYVGSDTAKSRRSCP